MHVMVIFLSGMMLKGRFGHPVPVVKYPAVRRVTLTMLKKFMRQMVVQRLSFQQQSKVEQNLLMRRAVVPVMKSLISSNF